MFHAEVEKQKRRHLGRLTGDYATDVASFDEIHRQAMIMADELADGIVKQFPKQFEVDITAAGKN